jgi:hypothetical protein
MEQTAAIVPSAADLRAKIARRQLRLYQLAPEIGCHPSRLGILLTGRVPLPAPMASRIDAAIEKLTGRE